MNWIQQLACSLALLALAPATALALVQPVTAERLADAAAETDNWLSHGRDLAETRHSPLTQVNADTVGGLALEWFFDFPDTRGLEGTPLVADGVMYVTGNWSIVHALDAQTGRALWRYDPGVDRKRANAFCCGVVNRGVALWQDSVILATLDGYLIAIDRRSGKEQWRTLTIDPTKNYSITGAPRIANGVVIIGNAGSEYGVRGYVGGYDVTTGEQLWRFYTVPGDPAEGFESELMAMAARTWNGQWWTMGGGGTVWDAIAYDPDLDLVYIGVGNGGPHNQEMRSPGGGDNLFIASIVALRPATGEYVWHHQQNPGETWDYTASQQMVLATIEWEGRPRRVLMQAPKNGFFFILDRVTGQLLSAEPYVPVNWATGYDLDTGRPIEVPEARYKEARFMLRPSGLGGHNWHSMAYNQDTGLMYIPAMDFPAPMEQEEEYTWFDNQWNLGYKVEASPFGKIVTQAILRRMADNFLLAWDPLEQREVWRAPNPDMGSGGVLSTAGNLVFQGTQDNRFTAYNARTGEALWRFDTQQGVVAAPVSYAIDGKQYITVMAGQGGGFSMMAGLEKLPATDKRRVLTFSLSGSAELPPFDMRRERSEAPPPLAADSDQIARGGHLYARFCARCHGSGVVSDGSVPDLRLLDNNWYTLFDDVVLDGMVESLGMPRFDDVLTREQSADIKSYVLHHAHDQWQLQQQSPLWLAIKTWFADVLAIVLVWLSGA